ncbi:tRNA dimethylallyltransferase, mitochondrial [Batrachochytrium dendrobatidis]|nr:tRNA dimethylallyltransferase, mitochondrial [Batrachochytrium dendrobatidis]KAK5672091.1 tRNA dimethylallyltransferase, mitochondrial [Batrachochytrium dendrobatidis]
MSDSMQPAFKKCIVAVIGTTGVGKSKLAVQIAKAIGGQIVNADSMQVYKGLDIATNKPTSNELALVPHHLFSFVDPLHEYSMSQFSRDAQAAIDTIHAQKHIPVIVGGTNYYIQSLLWEDVTIPSAPTAGLGGQGPLEENIHPSIDQTSELVKKLVDALVSSDPRVNTPVQLAEFIQLPTMYLLLEQIDPDMAHRWHPKNYRKIRRSLEIYLVTGKLHSVWIKEQKDEKKRHVTRLKYPTVFIWLNSQRSILNNRLNDRVDEMISNGLFSELQEMRNKVLAGQVIGAELFINNEALFSDASQVESDESDGESLNSTDTHMKITKNVRGIMQAIGFKEFEEYFKTLESKDSSKHAALDRMKLLGIEAMKTATRQYARQQTTWIRNKLAPACLAEHVDGHAAFYLIDATVLDDWETRIQSQAIQLVESFVKDGKTVDPQSISDAAKELLPNLADIKKEKDRHVDDHSQVFAQNDTKRWGKRRCDVCIDITTKLPKVVHGEHEWQIHINSRKHRKRVTQSKSNS